MQIPFPKMHIAQSVLNRISNTLEEEGPLGLTKSKQPEAPMMQEAPVVPQPEMLGTAIDEKIEQPTEPVALAPDAEQSGEDGMLGESIRGGSPFDGALIGAGF